MRPRIKGLTVFASIVVILLFAGSGFLPSSFASNNSSHQIFQVGNSPNDIKFNPSNGMLYVTSLASSGRSRFLSVVNPEKGIVTDIYSSDLTQEFSLVYISQYKEIYVGNGPGETFLKGTSVVGTINLENVIPQCSSPFSQTYDSTNGRIFGLCYSLDVDNSIYVVVIQPTSESRARVLNPNFIVLQITQEFPPCNGDGIAYNPSNNLIYTGDSCGSIFTINPNTYSMTHTITSSVCSSFSTCEMKYDPANNLVYLSDNVGGEIGCINAQFKMSICLPSVSGSPRGFAYDSASKLLYVANYYKGMVSAINFENKAVANYPIPSSLGTANFLAYDSANGHIYATTTNGYVYEVV